MRWKREYKRCIIIEKVVVVLSSSVQLVRSVSECTECGTAPALLATFYLTLAICCPSMPQCALLQAKVRHSPHLALQSCQDCASSTPAKGALSSFWASVPLYPFLHITLPEGKLEPGMIDSNSHGAGALTLSRWGQEPLVLPMATAQKKLVGDLGTVSIYREWNCCCPSNLYSRCKSAWVMLSPKCRKWLHCCLCATHSSSMESIF